MTAQNSQGGRPQRATLALALRDLGFIGGLFVTLVGAPSVLSLLQAVLLDLQLSAALQWLIDGYNEILARLSRALEPLLAQLLAFLREVFNVEIELRPYWRPLFVLSLIFISANTRTIWGDGYPGPAILNAAIGALFALLGSVIAGAAPTDGGPLQEGLIAGQFVLVIFIGLFLAYALATPLFGFRQPYRQPLWRYLQRGAVLAAGAALLAAALSLGGLPLERPGLAAVFLGMFLYGAYWFAYGFAYNVFPEVRFGLRLIGGFLFAALVLAVDLALT